MAATLSTDTGAGNSGMVETPTATSCCDAIAPSLPDAIFALHTAPFDVGTLAALADGMMAGRTRIDVTLSGTGDLGKAAEEVRKVISANGSITPDTMLSFQTEPFVFIDIIPQSRGQGEQSVVSAMVMSAGLAQRPKVKEKLKRSVESLNNYAVTLSIKFSQSLEGVNNDPELLELASSGIEKSALNIDVITTPGVMPAFSGDFGSFQKRLPGVMYFLGVNNPSLGTVGFPHSPDYVADDAPFVVGTEAMLAAML